MYVYKIRKVGTEEWWGDRKFTKRGRIWHTLNGAKEELGVVRAWFNGDVGEIVKFRCEEVKEGDKVFNNTYSMNGETQQEACERIARGLNG